MTCVEIKRRSNSQTLAEEVASAVTHGVGAALSIAGLTALAICATMLNDVWRVVGVSIFGGALVFLYLASTLYHGIQFRPVKQVFHILDHVGIALLIAGTYTPILLIKMRDTQGWIVFGVIWVLAIGGALGKSFFTNRFVHVSTVFYAGMGWIAVFLLKAMAAVLGLGGMAWLMAGGASYTLGIVPFLWQKLPYNHAIWHLFVMGGSACHFVMVWQYVLPPA